MVSPDATEPGVAVPHVVRVAGAIVPSVPGATLRRLCFGINAACPGRRSGSPDLAGARRPDDTKRKQSLRRCELNQERGFMKTGYLYGAAIMALTAGLVAPEQAAAQQTGAQNSTADDPAVSEGDAADRDIVVIGSALRNQETVRNRREAIGVVDTLTQDDTGDLADETLADALIRVPGVSSLQFFYGDQEAAFVSVRGVSPDLNFTSFDGLAMFSPANDGAGQRRVDLNLIPTQISRTTEVFKTFTSDLDAGAIGGVVNIVPYSALNGKETFYVDAFATLQTGYGKYSPGANAGGHYKDTPWGGGVKALWARRFGADEQFGIVLSGVFRQRNYDLTKRNPNGIAFYQANGAAAAADLSNWDGQHPLPTLIRPMDYNHFTRTYGGSAQLEYEPSPGLQISLLGYGYKQLEDMTRQQFFVEQFSNLVRTGPETATLKIGRARPFYYYDRFKPETRGGIFKVIKEFGPDSSLALRAGWNWNKFQRDNVSVAYAYSPPDSRINFDMSGLSDQFTITNYDPLINPENYKLNSISDAYVIAEMESKELRLDYKWNYGGNSSGFGFSAGIDVRDVDTHRDYTTINYISNNSVMGDKAFIPDGFKSYMWNYPYLRIDYDNFAETVKPGLAINQNSTANAAWSSDYVYDETVMAGYVSAMYGTDSFRAIAGLRYDDVDFTARSPIAVGGRYDGTFRRSDGRYRHILPSLLVTKRFGYNFRVKAAYSRTLGRPAFEDIAQAETRNEDSLTLSRGNPDLRPRRSDNFDIAAEYFFGGSGMISFGGFLKNIKDDIYSQSSELDIDGVTYQVTQPMNAQSSKLKGIEAQIVTNAIPGLPGFLKDKLGMSANVTRMWGELDYLSGTRTVHSDALPFQADWLVNATAFYRLPHNGEIRVAYTWASKSPVSLGAYPSTSYWLEARGQLDVAFRYALTPNVVLKLQAKDILQEPVAQYYYGDSYRMRRIEVTRPRSFQLDLIFKM